MMSCTHQQISTNTENKKDTLKQLTEGTETELHPFEEYFIRKGLVNILDIDSTIQVKLKYTGSNNFLGIDLYGDLEACYLLKEAAINLSKAQQALKKKHPGYSLLITDGARPAHIQQIMWDSAKISTEMKYKFLSSPKSGSVHSYGAAVDVTILDEHGNELDMGTPIDYFSELSYPILEKKHLQEKKLTQQQINNRILLRQVMRAGGYINIPTEWWHFNAWLRKNVIKKYSLLDIYAPTQPTQKSAEDINISLQIQLIVVSKPIADTKAIFKSLQVRYYIHENKYKYTTGFTTNIEEIYALRDIIRNTPEFKDAFVVAFNNNERISITEAVELLQ